MAPPPDPERFHGGAPTHSPPRTWQEEAASYCKQVVDFKAGDNPGVMECLVTGFLHDVADEANQAEQALALLLPLSQQANYQQKSKLVCRLINVCWNQRYQMHRTEPVIFLFTLHLLVEVLDETSTSEALSIDDRDDSLSVQKIDRLAKALIDRRLVPDTLPAPKSPDSNEQKAVVAKKLKFDSLKKLCIGARKDPCWPQCHEMLLIVLQQASMQESIWRSQGKLLASVMSDEDDADGDCIQGLIRHYKGTDDDESSGQQWPAVLKMFDEFGAHFHNTMVEDGGTRKEDKVPVDLSEEEDRARKVVLLQQKFRSKQAKKQGKLGGSIANFWKEGTKKGGGLRRSMKGSMKGLLSAISGGSKQSRTSHVDHVLTILFRLAVLESDLSGAFRLLVPRVFELQLKRGSRLRRDLFQRYAKEAGIHHEFIGTFVEKDELVMDQQFWNPTIISAACPQPLASWLALELRTVMAPVARALLSRLLGPCFLGCPSCALNASESRCAGLFDSRQVQRYPTMAQMSKGSTGSDNFYYDLGESARLTLGAFALWCT